MNLKSKIKKIYCSILVSDQNMSAVLPSTVEEINCMQNPFLYNQLIQVKGDKEGKFNRKKKLKLAIKF